MHACLHVCVCVRARACVCVCVSMLQCVVLARALVIVVGVGLQADYSTEHVALCAHSLHLFPQDVDLYYFLLLYSGRTLVFVNSIDCLQRLRSLLELLRLSPLPLHAHMQQRQRLKNLERLDVGGWGGGASAGWLWAGGWVEPRLVDRGRVGGWSLEQLSVCGWTATAYLSCSLSSSQNVSSRSPTRGVHMRLYT